MQFFLRRILPLAACLLTGCAARPATSGSVTVTKFSAPVIRDDASLTPAQKQQQRDEIARFVQPMTPPVREAYFKAHPEALKALNP